MATVEDVLDRKRRTHEVGLSIRELMCSCKTSDHQRLARIATYALRLLRILWTATKSGDYYITILIRDREPPVRLWSGSVPDIVETSTKPHIIERLILTTQDEAVIASLVEEGITLDRQQTLERAFGYYAYVVPEIKQGYRLAVMTPHSDIVNIDSVSFLL